MIDVKGKTVLDFIKNDRELEYFKQKFGVTSKAGIAAYLKSCGDMPNVNFLIELAKLSSNDDLLESSVDAYNKLMELRVDFANKNQGFMG